MLVHIFFAKINRDGVFEWAVHGQNGYADVAEHQFRHGVYDITSHADGSTVVAGNFANYLKLYNTGATITPTVTILAIDSLSEALLDPKGGSFQLFN